MRNTYTLLGITFLIIVAGAWYAFSRSAPADSADVISSGNTSMISEFTLTSSTFADGSSIPSQFTCDADPPGGGVSPPLEWSGVPEGTVSLALIMDDPDIPQVFKDQRGIGAFDHWTLFNISPETTSIPQSGATGTSGATSAGGSTYVGPCPPKEYEPSEHRYFFKLFALDTMLDLPAGASKAEVLAAMQGHVLAEVELMGRYKRR